MDSLVYLLAFTAVATAATFATRVIPFVFLSRHSDHPLILHLGRYLPAAVMSLLVVIFLLRSGHWSAPVFGADALVPSLVVVALHLWRRNALLSIIAGTACYMAIQQF
ncbi:branched-chain amino acid transporter permease [Marinobacter nanhaiticus D15-8W]|uniref:Branched-chain amino acid transporter n=1 Tax=Marinobacter nanhaiticus D15-8W TaxID=626887 RepID=N6WSZ9_9GAMM|nr:AzlD domain-containing protein [Marinobacter nanhaiticus]ENO14142.1 branched-chain amino acid transporter [Marinobacter nanhaiticus D15-8W]BES71526.1 branched-chain amino acid transporter permease [Marinobacter nanhaiticus D15-8W]